MKEINEYFYKVFDLVYKTKHSGLLEKPKKYTLNKNDKRILKKIYNVYKLYNCKISKEQFMEMVCDYSIAMNKDIITSGWQIAENTLRVLKK